MTNKKIVAGILTGIATGVMISLVLSTKKGQQTGKAFLKKGNRITDDLKGRFSDFIDGIQDKVHGILK
jgi:gas vesicle protein